MSVRRLSVSCDVATRYTGQKPRLTAAHTAQRSSGLRKSLPFSWERTKRSSAAGKGGRSGLTEPLPDRWRSPSHYFILHRLRVRRTHV